MRTITLHNYEGDDYPKALSVAGHDELWRAIGKLSTWAHESYPKVDIYCRDPQNPEIIAVYKDESGAQKYLIGAVWNHDSRVFGFHS